MTETELRGAFVNASTEELGMLALPHDFVLLDWDHLDFLAWRDPRTRSRGYVLVSLGGAPVAVVLRAANGTPQARSSMCSICHTMQPANQVALFTARKAGRGGESGNSVGTYLCADLSCHENVRLAAPLAPSEVRASVDRRIDGTRLRIEAFVARVLEDS